MAAASLHADDVRLNPLCQGSRSTARFLEEISPVDFNQLLQGQVAVDVNLFKELQSAPCKPVPAKQQSAVRHKP